jgi:hypothetical protein
MMCACVFSDACFVGVRLPSFDPFRSANRADQAQCRRRSSRSEPRMEIVC